MVPYEKVVWGNGTASGFRLVTASRPVPVERTGADAGDRVGDGHARQAWAAEKRIIVDAGDRVGDVHARQARAVIERTVVDDWFGDNNLTQCCTH